MSKAEQDARIQKATKQQVAKDNAETRRQQDTWGGRPSR